ncbi:MAG: MFS transporter [Deltaproteobacteria bacterium]|nr:MFS transporter [Deltaproteobacteria bacterium]
MPILRWVVAVAFFMQMLDGTILNTALPMMAKDLDVSPLRMQSAIIAYLLTAALIIPVSGWLGERFGIRRVFFLSLLLFTLGSFLCAVSPDLGILVFSRVVQGIGGALMVPVGRLAIIKAYSRRELVQVLSFVAIPGLIGLLIGPAVGGFLVEYASWHCIFLINLPVGGIGLWLAYRHMPDFASSEREKFDGPGFLLFGASMLLITLSMEGLGELHLPRIQVTLLCVTGLLLQAVYWLRSVCTPHPLFHPRIFLVRSFTVGILGNFFSRLGVGSMPFLIPLFLQLGLGYSPFKAGMVMIPSALAGIIGKSIIARLIRLMGYRCFLSLNTVLVGALIAGFAAVTAQTSLVFLLLHLALFGVFNSLQYTAMNTVTLIDLSNEEAGSGNSLLSVTMQIALSSGVAMAAALLNGFNVALGGVESGVISLSVFRLTFLCVGAFTAATALVFAQAPKKTGN